MKYLPLREPCKTAIEKGYCMGCNRLELPNFVGKYDCKYSHPPETRKTEESINEIKKTLGIQERIKL